MSTFAGLPVSIGSTLASDTSCVILDKSPSVSGPVSSCKEKIELEYQLISFSINKFQESELSLPVCFCGWKASVKQKDVCQQ